MDVYLMFKYVLFIINFFFGQISESLELTNIKNRQWAIFKTCAKSGKGLDDAFKWYIF